MPDVKKRSGVVCIIGRPSAGKSTFVNSVCGEKVSIVSALPQTTRNAVRGILTAAQGQIVFIDTPGYHTSEKKMNRRLQAITENRLRDADAVLYLTDSTRSFGEEEQAICTLLAGVQDRLVAAVNKTDIESASAGQTRLSIIQALPAVPQEHIFDISAQEKIGLDALLDSLFALLPEGVPLYPEDFYTDQPVDFRIAEIIREQAISRLYEEIPHAVYVDIQDMEMKKNGKELFVRAFLCVERESQKSMVIGKGAAVIKAIRIESQNQLRTIFPYRVQLDLQVRVDKNWRQKDRVLRSLLQD
ncbi:MAG: GTPase Era [Treponema sp.]